MPRGSRSRGMGRGECGLHWGGGEHRSTVESFNVGCQGPLIHPMRRHELKVRRQSIQWKWSTELMHHMSGALGMGSCIPMPMLLPNFFPPPHPQLAIIAAFHSLWKVCTGTIVPSPPPVSIPPPCPSPPPGGEPSLGDGSPRGGGEPSSLWGGWTWGGKGGEFPLWNEASGWPSCVDLRCKAKHSQSPLFQAPRPTP